MTLTIDYIKKNWVPNKTEFNHDYFGENIKYIYHHDDSIIGIHKKDIIRFYGYDFKQIKEIKQKKKIKLFRYTYKFKPKLTGYGEYVAQSDWSSRSFIEHFFTGKVDLLKTEEKEIEVDE